MTCRTPIGLQPFSRQLAKMFLLQLLPGIDHISLTLDPVAVQAAIAAVESMDHEKPNQTMQPTAGRRTEQAFRDSNLSSRRHARRRQRWLTLVSLGP